MNKSIPFMAHHCGQCASTQVQGALDTAARMAAGEIPLEGCGRSWEFGWRPYSGSGFSTSGAAAGSSGRPAPLPFGGVGHLAILDVEVGNACTGSNNGGGGGGGQNW